MEKTTSKLPSHVLWALSKVFEYLWHEEQRDFLGSSKKRREKHIYRALTVLDRWRSNPSGEPDYFGDCPQCQHGGNDGFINIGRDHWFVCHLHQLKWCVGENLFSCWRKESNEDWEENYKLVEQYAEIPIPQRK